MARVRIRLDTPDADTPSTPRPRVRVRLGSKAPTTIDQALRDPNLLGAGLGSPETWSTWTAVLRAAFGLPLSSDDLERFHTVAGDREPPTERVSELWAVLGRRSGKTRIAAAISVHIATLEKHRLAPGEVGYVLLLASSRSQAGVAFAYVVGFLEASPILRQQIESVTADEVRLKGNIVIGVHSNSYRTVRGRSLLAVVGDETSFWRDESSAAPDVETYRACIPALAATGGLFIGISTGYRKMGLLYQKWRDHFGQNTNDMLVVQGGTQQFNPTLDVAVIDRAKSNDPEASESEWNGGFRNDISAFLDDEVIDAAINHSRPPELPPRAGTRFHAFSDASGGRHDAFTLCIGHREGDQLVCDVIRGEKPPFDPNVIVARYAALLKEYKITKIQGDNYSAAWVETAWRDNGIVYERSELPKSGLYLESLPLFVRGLVSIPDHARLIRELRLLERRTTRSGRDSVDHGKQGSDDYANSLCGLIYLLSKKYKYRYIEDMSWVGTDDDWRAAGLQQHIFGRGLFR